MNKRRLSIICILISVVLLFNGCRTVEVNNPPADITETDLTVITDSADDMTIETVSSSASAAESKTENEDNNNNTLSFYYNGSKSNYINEVIELSFEFYRNAGYSPIQCDDSKNADVIIESVKGLGEEGYRIKKDKPVILNFSVDGNCNGLFYGLNAYLKQLLSGNIKTDEVIPDTKERVLMLDCARKFWSVDWIKMLINQMCWMGYNTIEFHFTEEQGIRFNIWKNADGTVVKDCNGNDFSFICGGSKVSWNKNYSEHTGLYYDRDEIKEILDYAVSRHLKIIPAVDFPGHSYNLINRCKGKNIDFYYDGNHYSLNGDKISAAGSNSQCIDISSENVRAFSFAIAEAYADYFGKYNCNCFNIGADEVVVNDDSWSVYARKNSGKTQFDAFIIYINSLVDLLQNMGYKVRAFNDYLYSQSSNIGLNKELEICWWNGNSSYFPDDRVIYNCIQNNCYYVLRKTSSGVDARDKNCTHWDFNHSTAQRIYSGCGKADCPCKGGWSSTRFWKNNYSAPAGAYFLIWGDWAASDSEDNIFFRNDNYSLVDRMWANIIKMIDSDFEKRMNYESFCDMISSYRLFPGCKVK